MTIFHNLCNSFLYKGFILKNGIIHLFIIFPPNRNELRSMRFLYIAIPFLFMSALLVKLYSSSTAADLIWRVDCMRQKRFSFSLFYIEFLILLLKKTGNDCTRRKTGKGFLLVYQKAVTTPLGTFFIFFSAIKSPTIKSVIVC